MNEIKSVGLRGNRVKSFVVRIKNSFKGLLMKYLNEFAL